MAHLRSLPGAVRLSLSLETALNDLPEGVTADIISWLSPAATRSIFRSCRMFGRLNTAQLVTSINLDLAPIDLAMHHGARCLEVLRYVKALQFYSSTNTLQEDRNRLRQLVEHLADLGLVLGIKDESSVAGQAKPLQSLTCVTMQSLPFCLMHWGLMFLTQDSTPILGTIQLCDIEVTWATPDRDRDMPEIWHALASIPSLTSLVLVDLQSFHREHSELSLDLLTLLAPLRSLSLMNAATRLGSIPALAQLTKVSLVWVHFTHA